MMKNSKRLGASLISVAILSLFGVAVPAFAQDAGFGKPAGVPWGPVTVYPEVDLTFKSNDNIYSQSGDPTREKTSSNITVLAPKIKLEAKTGPHTFDVTYGVEHGRYSTGSNNNYTDQSIAGNAAWVFSGRSGLKLSAGYQTGHDDRGSVPNVGHPDPDKWHQSSFSGVAGYGAEGAQGRVEVEGGLINKRYDNFKTVTTPGATFGNPDNTKRDRDDTKIGATFFWRIAPKTQLLFQATQTKFDYQQASSVDVATAQLDSTDRNYAFGVTWEAAAKTTGIFKIGNVKKDFSDSRLRDFSGGSWDGTIKWAPLTYSTFDFNTGRSTGESTVGNASLDTKYGVVWNHAWSSRMSSVVSFNNTKNEQQNVAGLSQTDKTDTWGLKLNYRWTRTLKVGAGYDHTDKSSPVAAQKFKRNIYSIFLNAAI